MEIFASQFEEEDEFVRSQKEETNLMFAIAYLSFLDPFLSDFDKQNLKFAIAYFPYNGPISNIFDILEKSEILNDDQVDTIINCLFNELVRTRLIVRINMKGILIEKK